MKQNIKKVFSVFACLLVMSLLSFMSIPLSTLLKGMYWKLFIHAVLPCVLLGMLVYSRMWELGWKIPSRRKLYKEKHSNYKALGICAAAFAPSLFLLLLWKLTDYFVFELLFRAINFYCVGLFEFAPNYFKLLALMVILIEIAIGQIAYILGIKRISLYTKAVYVDEKKEKKK